MAPIQSKTPRRRPFPWLGRCKNDEIQSIFYFGSKRRRKRYKNGLVIVTNQAKQWASRFRRSTFLVADGSLTRSFNLICAYQRHNEKHVGYKIRKHGPSFKWWPLGWFAFNSGAYFTASLSLLTQWIVISQQRNVGVCSSQLVNCLPTVIHQIHLLSR